MNSLKMKIKIDISYFILTLTFSAVYCDIQRTEDGSFLEDFIIVNKGHMHYPTILMFMEELDVGACAETCRRHLSCVTFNYNWIRHACELVDRRFDEGEAVFDEPDWYNFGTPAKIDGGWSNWKKTPCSVICGNGTITKYRTCTAPEPKYGGAPCIGREAHTVSCEMPPCVPIDGGLSDWVNDGKCSVTCGVGQQFQMKTCTNPPPQYGGKDCTTTPKRSITCNNQNCPCLKTKLGECCKSNYIFEGKVYDNECAYFAVTKSYVCIQLDEQIRECAQQPPT